MIIGMLHHRKDPQTVTKAYAYAVVAQAEGAELLYFSPRMVDLVEKRIHGWVYANGNWRQVERRFPDVVYNAGSPFKLARSAEIVNALKAAIPFTTFSIGNKMRVYQRLTKAKEFAHYLVPSEFVKSTEEFLDFLDLYRKIVFKPVNGRKGQGIALIERVGNQYQVQLDGTSQILDYFQLKKYFRTQVKQEPYMVQPYINCKNKLGQSYDFRLHVQKNEANQWVLTAVYPRIGTLNSIVSNINNGGSTNYITPFLKQEFGEEYYEHKSYLEQFALQIARHLDRIQQEHFSESIDELGIDVGFDASGKIWIYEINWRPGCPPAFYLELNVVRNMIKYALYLAKHQRAK